MKYKPHEYQLVAIAHILENPYAGCFLDMGLGKTSITLTALEFLINSVEIRKPLIIGPKLVTEQTWSAEIAKWDHTKNLKLSRIIGTEKERIAALYRPADMYAVSRDNIAWLVQYLLKQPKKIWPFDALIIDELSSFKNRDSMRFKALRKVAPRCERVIGLTGTPAPNSLLDLWPQMFLLDQGQRLGKTLTEYRNNYFNANYNGFGYEIKEGVSDIIHDKIKDICISMRAIDHLQLKQRMDIPKHIDLATMKGYLEFRKKETLALTDELEITPLTAAGLYSKLLQYCNGAVYDEDKTYHVVDNTKLDAVVEAYEELNGQPVIIFYSFRSDIERITKRIPEAQMIKNSADIERWNRGEIKCLLAHPASMGHGLNLQAGGHYMFWFGLPWSLELYLQAVARLDRQGQLEQVRNLMFIAKGTVEEIVLQRLIDKTLTQDALIAALKKHLLV